MPVKIACPKCSKKYTLPDSAVGKPVKCKACETTFRTKMPSGAAPASPPPAKPTAQPKKTAQQKPRQQRPKPAQPASPNLSEFGIDGGFQQQADIFGSPAQGSVGLDNFAEEDTFGTAVDPIVLSPSGAAEAPPENPFQSVMTNSSMRGSGARNKARKKKRRKGSADVSAYGVVRIGMMCVFGAGAALLFATFVMLIMSVLGQAINGGTQANAEPGALEAVFGIVALLLMGLSGISWLVLIVGQIMCMFAPEGNERLNSIGAGALAFFAMIGSVVITLVLGVAVAATAGPSGPSATEAATFGIGAVVVLLICGLMMLIAMFMFVNFYRRVGKNIKSNALVKVSNQATIAICGALALPFLAFAIGFILGIAGVDQETGAYILGAFSIFNALFSLVVSAVILRMVWTGISSLKPG